MATSPSSWWSVPRFAVAVVLVGLPVAAAAQTAITQPQATAGQTVADAVWPPVSGGDVEFAFSAHPIAHLLNDGPADVTAAAVAPSACPNAPVLGWVMLIPAVPSPNEGAAAPTAPAQTPTSATTSAPTASPATETAITPANVAEAGHDDAPVTTRDALPARGLIPLTGAGRSLVCPFTITAPLRLSDPASGWLLPTANTTVGDRELVTYQVIRRPSSSAYFGLLGGSAFFVTLVSLVICKKRRRRTSRKRSGCSYPKMIADVPVLAAITATGTSLVLITDVLTDFIPGFRIGGVVGVGIIAGVLAAAGPATAKARFDGAREVGGAIMVFGLVLLALLNPFMLLHGTIDGGGIRRTLWIAACLILLAAIFVRAAPPEAQPSQLDPVARFVIELTEDDRGSGRPRVYRIERVPEPGEGD